MSGGGAGDSPRPPSPAPLSPARRRMFRVLFAVVLPLCAAAALEVFLRSKAAESGEFLTDDEALRWTRVATFEASGDPEIVYANRRGYSYDAERRIDEFGLHRLAPITMRKAPGTVRVALIGDSVGASAYLPDADRPHTALERRVGELLRRRVEVPNFCVSGYDGIQSARTLETRVADFEPDAVVFLVCPNDTTVTRVPWVWFRPERPPVSHLLRAITDGTGLTTPGVGDRPWTPRGSPSAAGAARAWSRAWDPAGPGVAALGSSFERMGRWSRERKVPVVAAVMPLVLPEEDSDGRAIAQSWVDRALAMAGERGLATVSLAPILDSAPHRELRLQDGDIYHLAAPGVRAAADILAPAIVSALR